MKKYVMLVVLMLVAVPAYATRFVSTYEQAIEKIDYKNPTVEQLKSCDWVETDSPYNFNVVCHEPGVKKLHLYKVWDNFTEPQNLHQKKRRKANESYKIQEEI